MYLHTITLTLFRQSFHLKMRVLKKFPRCRRTRGMREEKKRSDFHGQESVVDDAPVTEAMHRIVKHLTDPAKGRLWLTADHPSLALVSRRSDVGERPWSIEKSERRDVRSVANVCYINEASTGICVRPLIQFDRPIPFLVYDVEFFVRRGHNI